MRSSRPDSWYVSFTFSNSCLSGTTHSSAKGKAASTVRCSAEAGKRWRIGGATVPVWKSLRRRLGAHQCDTTRQVRRPRNEMGLLEADHYGRSPAGDESDSGKYRCFQLIQPCSARDDYRGEGHTHRSDECPNQARKLGTTWRAKLPY